MTSMDSLMEQLEKRGAGRVSSQRPSDATQSPGVDRSCKQSVVLNGSSNILENYCPEEFLRTIESVGNKNSYDFINNEKSQSLKFVKEGVGKPNDSAEVQKNQCGDDKCELSNTQHTIKQIQEKTTHSESNINNSPSRPGVVPMQQQGKLQKQNAVDIANVSLCDLGDHFYNLSTPSSHSSDISSQQTDAVIVDQKLPSDTENVDLGRQETKSQVSSGSVEKEAEEELLARTSRQESIEKEKKLKFTIPDDVPAVSGWKLDRRESGHLFWRRDSSTLNGVDPSSRVKFRYDVEVCEFESRESETDDLLEEDEEEQENSMLLNSEKGMQKKTCKNGCALTVENSYSATYTILYFFAAFGIIASIIYGWLRYLYFNERVEESKDT